MTKLPTGRHTQTIKSVRKNKELNLKNKSLRSRAMTYIRKVTTAIKENKVEEARTLLPTTSKFIDTAASKGAFHKKKASRLKSRLTKKINQSKTEK